MRRLLSACAAALSLAACTATTQTTSGEEYLKRWSDRTTPTTISKEAAALVQQPEIFTMDDALRLAASVEPMIETDASIGLARIERGRWIEPPREEAEVWARRFAELGAGRRIGLVDPLVGRATLEEISFGRDVRFSTLNQIRLAGARQHFDAVLIYEVDARRNRSTTRVPIAERKTLSDFLLPAYKIEAEVLATAILMDVRNGYPYLRVNAQRDFQEVTKDSGSGGRADELTTAVTVEAVDALSKEAQTALREVEQRTASLSTE